MTPTVPTAHRPDPAVDAAPAVDGAGEALVALALGHTLPRAGAAVVDTLVDTIAVTIAGQRTETVRTLRRWQEASLGDTPVWGTGERLAPSRAALRNGTAAHALDYDDAGLTMPIHPSAVLWPTVLALATPQTPTARLLAAVEAGHVLIRALADVLPISAHYDRGWHATSTLGVLAATAAGAGVAGLSAGQARTALGIAASTAAGSLANFGTMTKPFHAGRAASDAVQAVGLAQAGFTANPGELDDPRGFLARHGAPTGVVGVDLGERIAHWLDAWGEDCAVKQFAACFGTHRALAATARLRPEVADLTAIRSIRVEAHPATLRPLRAALPVTGDEATFSMAFNVAQVLRTGGVGPGDFTMEAIAANAGLMALVETVAADSPSIGPDLGGRRFARVELVLADGRTLARTVTLDEPADRPDAAAIDDKLVRCLTAVGVSETDAAGLPARIRAAAAAPAATALDAVLSLHLTEEDA
ncbi:MmgE/PrpD family protein [Nocardioides nematodiphilus]|uniref:MmgE/PrpD family protein n=1 Tax=Nocardioides nematodiphilus TaxID=2849669 RepID=UPI001CDA35E8|nr:MmgE/PrpD family protein [Nocardioides nematodiphilus]MCA1983249.1 MmgE/PrpD family protein [Nocardioides nematodiphilus]